MNSCGIYQIKNLINNKCYIGQTVDLDKRKVDHFGRLRKNKHENQHLQKAFNKYGEDNFSFNILIYCENFELTKYEQFFSDCYKKLDFSYNMRECVDSNKGLPCSEGAKRKMSEKQKGEKAYNYKKVFSEETRNRISKKLKGISHSEEHIKNLSLSLKNSPKMKNREHSEETKRKISEAHKGKHNSEETKRRISEKGKGRKMSEKWKKQNRERQEGEKSHRFGKETSEEVKKKISESLKRHWENKEANNV
jgi:group I intron endonuclease